MCVCVFNFLNTSATSSYATNDSFRIKMNRIYLFTWGSRFFSPDFQRNTTSINTHRKIYCKFSTETIRDLMRERKKKDFFGLYCAYSNLIAGEAFVFVLNLKYHENQSTDKYTWRRDAHARGSFYRSDISLKKQPVIKIYISLSLCSKTNIKRIHNLSIENSRIF